MARSCSLVIISVFLALAPGMKAAVVSQATGSEQSRVVVAFKRAKPQRDAMKKLLGELQDPALGFLSQMADAAGARETLRSLGSADRSHANGANYARAYSRQGLLEQILLRGVGNSEFIKTDVSEEHI